MKKSTVLLLMLGIGIITSKTTSAQSTVTLQGDKCLAEIMFQEAAAKDPSLIEKRAAIDKFAAEYAEKQKSQKKVAAGPKIIPVVFHIIHECGTENITREQCIDAVRILNADYRRLNDDRSNTPAHFDSLSSDCNIEFRLAKIDPTGKPTEGINRVYSSLTTNARDNIKALSYWDSKKYMNVWVVKSIQEQGNTGGITIGYAQFPGGAAATDGLVLRSDHTGSIGTAQGNTGRVATHEVGHWLNLRHIWGDAQCGDDMVADTPVQFDKNFSTCPSYPSVTACSMGGRADNGPYGDMFMNYMDYTDDHCQNMFSTGQGVRMNAALAGTRTQIWSASNLVATGTDDGAVQQMGVPRVYICGSNSTTCEGNTVSFSATTYNGTPDSYLWSFPGGTPSTSTAANPTIQYNAAGTYNISLTTSNAVGSDSTKKSNYVTITPATPKPSASFSDGFENDLTAGWSVVNPNNDAVAWSVVAVGHTSSKSIRINNYSSAAAGNKDYIISPALNFTDQATPKLMFSTAYAYKGSTVPSDKFTITYSTDCGTTWKVKTSITPANLQTAGVVANSFSPKNAGQWKQQTVDLTSLKSLSNVLLRFEFTSGTGGNNLYIDDINLTGIALGIADLTASDIELHLAPNPTENEALLTFNLQEQKDVNIKIYDLLGREVKSIVTAKLSSGSHSYQINNIGEKGIYFVKILVGNSLLTQKLILN